MFCVHLSVLKILNEDENKKENVTKNFDKRLLRLRHDSRSQGHNRPYFKDLFYYGIE